MSRVPVSWSMIPTAMNNDALNVAWFMMWKIAATCPSGVSRPMSRVISPKMADRRIGEQPFQVLLENSDERAEDEGDQACRSHEPQPLISSSQRRPEPYQKEDAGVHHGG